MKRFVTQSLLLVALGVNSITLTAQQLSTKIIKLNENWEFSEARKNEWNDARVPGTIHQDLLRLKKLPDPFYGTNQKQVQWVEDKDWEYKTTFELTKEDLEKEGATLTFEGLDTYADVYLNGSLILKTENMFVGHEVEVKDELRLGKNRLHIYFYSPINKVLPQWESNGFDYPADNDHHDKHTSVFTRKAPYHYGWDWGIRMVGVGVWRPITLYLYNGAQITDLHIVQNSLTEEEATLTAKLKVDAVKDINQEAKITYSYSLNNEVLFSDNKSIDLQEGENNIELPLLIKDPELWMPIGWGNPTLYKISAQIEIGGDVVASKAHKIGLRTVKLINEEDKDGKSFYFEVNGHPMFMKGANYIPNDIILTNVKKQDYDRLFDDIVAANMNMIRVWGGGIYEDDYFYQLADERGILIWQDFMFACTSYPADNAFLENIKKEADYNIIRLRNHPSIAMWCGNNEILEGIKYWGWNKRFTKEVHQSMFTNYNKLFRQLLPERVKELDIDRFYLHGSPDTANWGRPKTLGWGDNHYWGVWYGREPFEVLDTRLSRFMSEFGFQAFPEMKVISSFSKPEDYALESEVMKAHQKSSTGNSIIKTYMEMYYHVPEKFEDFVYVGLVLQGEGMRHGFEAHRRNRPFCMGTLYWQLNDSWPVVSWSSIDYYGNWKALHYQAKRAFSPILINTIEELGMVNTYLISDKLDQLKGLELETKHIDFSGKVLSKKSKRVNLPANGVILATQSDSATIASIDQRRNTFLIQSLKDSKGTILDQQLFYFEKPKDLNLPQPEIKHKIRVKEGECELILRTDKLAKDVFIEVPIQGCRFSDNFFDLLPGETKKIIIKSPMINKSDRIDYTIKHLRETYK